MVHGIYDPTDMPSTLFVQGQRKWLGLLLRYLKHLAANLHRFRRAVQQGARKGAKSLQSIGSWQLLKDRKERDLNPRYPFKEVCVLSRDVPSAAQPSFRKRENVKRKLSFGQGPKLGEKSERAPWRQSRPLEVRVKRAI